MGTLQVTLSGTILGSPASSSDSQFPSSALNIPFQLTPSPKTFNVAAGGVPVSINSTGSYVVVPGIGAAPGPVTEAQLLYVRVSTPMLVRLTYKGDATPYVSKVGGLLVIEVDAANPITKFEVQGAGTLEFYATGLV